MTLDNGRRLCRTYHTQYIEIRSKNEKNEQMNQTKSTKIRKHNYGGGGACHRYSPAFTARPHFLADYFLLGAMAEVEVGRAVAVYRIPPPPRDAASPSFLHVMTAAAA